jgi:hypothetical protein
VGAIATFLLFLLVLVGRPSGARTERGRETRRARSYSDVGSLAETVVSRVGFSLEARVRDCFSHGLLSPVAKGPWSMDDKSQFEMGLSCPF